MTTRFGASSRYITEAFGGGGASSAATATYPVVISTDVDASASAAQAITFAGSFQRSFKNAINDIRFPMFTGGSGQEVLVCTDTGGWWRFRPVVGNGPSGALLEEYVDGQASDIASVVNALVAPENKRAWVTHGRKRTAVRLSDCERMSLAEDKSDFAVTGKEYRERPIAVEVDRVNNRLYTVTEEGGIYCESIATPSAPTTAKAAISIAESFSARERVVDVQGWFTPGEEVLAVLTTDRVYTISITGATMFVLGMSEQVTASGLVDANPVSAASVTPLKFAQCERMTLQKNADLHLVAYVEGLAAGYGLSRPSARIIVACNLDLAGTFAAPRFLQAVAPYCVFYNPMPVAPSAWAAFVVTNPSAKKVDYAVARCRQSIGGGVHYLYVCHGRMRQIRRLDVSTALTTGITVGAIIPIDVGYTTDPATNTSPNFSQMVVDPADYERFLAYAEYANCRVVVLNAGLETVATNNQTAVNTVFMGTGLHDVAIINRAGSTLEAWSVDFRGAAFNLRVIDWTGATPTVTFEKYWSRSSDGCYWLAAGKLYMLTFGGVVMFERASASDPFVPVQASYQPARGNDIGAHGVRDCYTEQMDGMLAVNGTDRLITCCAEGGLMEYKLDAVTKYPSAGRFMPQPAEFELVGLGAPLDGWENIDGSAGPAGPTFYANACQYYSIGGVHYALQDITNRKRGEMALVVFKYNSGTDNWDYFTAVKNSHTYGAYSVPLTYWMHVTSDLTGRAFCFITYDQGFFVVRLDELTSNSRVTLVGDYPTTTIASQIRAQCTSKGRLFNIYWAPGGDGTRGQVVMYDFNALTGVPDLSTPLQVLDSASLSMPVGSSWDTSYAMRFLQTNGTTGAGIIGIGTGGGTYIELGYDPSSGVSATATFQSTVEPRGHDSSVRWRYRVVGAASSFATASVAVPAATLSADVSTTVTGLLAGTDYEVWVEIAHVSGPLANQVREGEHVIFTTPSASGSNPPLATTLPAYNVGSTTVSLAARVNPNGRETAVTFTYVGGGQTITTTAQSAGAGFGVVPIFIDIAGLAGDTDYAFFVTALNDLGQTTIGHTLLFTTTHQYSAPKIVSLVFDAGLIGSTSASADVGFDIGDLAGFVYVDYGITPGNYTASSGAIAVGANKSRVTIPLTGLTAATTYYARASANNSLGTGVGTEVVFTTAAANSAPSVLTALPDNINQNFADLHALVNPNGLLTTVTFDIWDDATAGDPIVTSIEAIATSSASSQTVYTCTATGLLPFTLYNVQARGSNVDGSASGAVVKFRTAGGVSSGVLVPTTSPETLVTSTSATLNGTLACVGIPTAWYFEFWITGQAKKFTPARLQDFPPFAAADVVTPTSEPIAGLTAASTYNYRLCGVSAGTKLVQYGTTEVLTTLSAPTPPPATGQIISMTPVAATKMDMRGKVTATNGEDTDIVFQASLSQSFAVIAASSVLQTVPAANPSPPLFYATTLTGLSANTPYFGRLKMTHNDGNIVSYSQPFGPVSTNAFVPPGVTTNALSNATATTMQANGTIVVPSDIGAGDVMAWVEYGTTPRASGVGYDVVTAPTNCGHTIATVQTQFQMGGTGSPSALKPDTQYYARWKASNAAGTTVGAEVTLRTAAAPASNDPVPVALGVRFVTPYSFVMDGTLQTNGSTTTVVPQLVRSNDALGWASGSVISLASQTIADRGVTQLIGAFTGYLTTPSVGWNWRFKVTNATGVDRFAYPTQTAVLCPNPVPNPLFALATAVAQTGQLSTFKDAHFARARFYLKHNGKRTWCQLEYGTDATFAVHTKGRLISYMGPARGAVTPGAGPQGEMRYADYMEALTPETQYFYRLRCWSVEGEHTSASNSFITDTISGTAGFKPWSTTWAASVGTQIPANGMMSEIPANLETGAGTRSPTNEVVWGPLTYSPAEDSKSIIVTPTSVQVMFDPSSNATIRDGASASPTSHPVLAYALRVARVGDKIWVDGTHKSIGGIWYNPENGSISEGDIVENASQTWTGMVHRKRGVYNVDPVKNTQHFQIRILTGTPPIQIALGADPTYETIRKVGATSNNWTGIKLYYSGGYVYEGFNCGGDASTGGHTFPSELFAYWGTSTRRYPITGVRILPKTAGTRWGIMSMTFGNGDGGLNGVFFRGFDATNLFTGSAACWITTGQNGNGGIGVRGRKDYTFKQYDPNAYGGFGVKWQTRDQSPCTLDDRDGTLSPANEHGEYIDSHGEINRFGGWMVNVTQTGLAPDGVLNYSQRAFLQVDARGDLSQNSSTGPGYAPGRGPFTIKGCTGKAGNQAGCISIWGYFGDVTIDSFTHNALPGPDTRQSMVLQDNDPEKGMWFNANGYQTNSVTITNFVANVGNEEDSFIQTRGIERLIIGDCTWNGPNNKALFSFYEQGLIDNGFVQFTGAGSSANALRDWAKWPANVSVSNRIQYKSQGKTSDAQFQELQDGKQYSAIQ